MVMLVGEPGIGKTRTAQELAPHAEGREVQVLWGRCYQEEEAPPYWPWVQLIQSSIREKSSEQLQSEMGPGAAEIAVTVPELGEKRDRLGVTTSPGTRARSVPALRLHHHLSEECRPNPIPDVGLGSWWTWLATVFPAVSLWW